MTFVLSLLVGVLFAASVYLMLQRNRLETLIGFALFANAVNLAILAGSGWNAADRPPILESEYEKVTADGTTAFVSNVDPSQYADPVPQALILTAIVIGFALISFFMVLLAELSRRERDIPDEEAGQS